MDIPPKPEGPVPAPMSNVVNDIPGPAPEPTAAHMNAPDRIMPSDMNPGPPRDPGTPTAVAVAATALEAEGRSPGAAGRVADAFNQMQGTAAPAGVPSTHILFIASMVIIALAVFSGQVMFSPESQYDDSMKATVMQAWITFGALAIGFYLGSSAGSKNAGAREGAREAARIGDDR